MKHTMKAVRAAAIICIKYGVDILHVLDNERVPDNMYLELQADGYKWDTKCKRWLVQENDGRRTPAAIEPDKIGVHIRLMTSDAVAMSIAESLILEALTDAEIVVTREPRSTPNRDGHGMRCYFDVEV